MLKLLKTKALYGNSVSIVFGFLLLSFCFDFINKINIFYDFEFLKFSKILKFLFLFYSVMFIVTHFKYVRKNFKVLLTTFIVLSTIFILKNNLTERYIIEYVRYIFPLLTFPLIYFTFINKKDELLKNLYEFFKWFIIVNAGLILLSVLFKINIFETYNSQRFGFNGIILSQGVTPYIYLCATTLFWVFNDKKMLFLILVLSVLTGVKGVYFGEFLLMSLFVLSNKKFNTNFKIKISILLLICFLGLIAFLFLMPTFREVLKTDGLLSAIFSYRIDYALDLLKEMNSNNYNIFIGTITLLKVRLEMQIIDIILFFGFIGLIAYGAFLYSLYLNLLNNNISKVFFVSCLFLSVLNGNLLYVPLSFILMFLLLVALKKN